MEGVREWGRESGREEEGGGGGEMGNEGEEKVWCMLF